MQLGKLDVSSASQLLSCKTMAIGPKQHQKVVGRNGVKLRVKALKYYLSQQTGLANQ
jgi:hypothetical protein